MQPEAELSATIVPAFADNVSVNTSELAQALRVSRFTVHAWKRAGYQFELGTRTTPGHCKDWLRSRPKPPITRTKKDTDNRVEDFVASIQGIRPQTFAPDRGFLFSLEAPSKQQSQKELLLSQQVKF
jgi:hypothetical protein